MHWKTILFTLFLSLSSAYLTGQSQEGLVVFYRQSSDGIPEIWSMKPDGTKKTNLSGVTRNSPGWVASDGAKWPRISPDGTRVAYYNYRDGGKTQHIVVMNLDGSGKRELTVDHRNSDPAWSPDGKRIIYRRVVEGRSGLWILDADTGESHPLVNNPETDRGPDWSLAGDWIVFSNGFGSDREGGEDLYRIRPDGSDLERLTSATGEDSLPSISPDGKWVAFNSQRSGQTDIYILDMETKAARRLTEFGDAYAAAWRPDGKRVLFTRVNGNQYDLFSCDPTGKNLVQHTNGSTRESTAHWGVPTWNRARIAYQSRAAGNDDIWIMDADGRFPRQLTTHPGHDRNPSWSPDGKTIFFESNRDQVWGVYAQSVTGAMARRVTPPGIMDKYPSLSFDGKRLIFIGFNENRVLVKARPAEGGPAQTILDSGHLDRYPSFSPDGARIAFGSDRDTDLANDGSEHRGLEIYIAGSDGSQVKRLTTNQREDSLVRWSPDGAWLVFNSARTSRFHIHKIKPDGSSDIPLTSGEHDNWSPDWTSDGQGVVFISNREGNPEIYRMDADGKNLERLTQTKEGEGAPAWWSPVKRE